MKVKFNNSEEIEITEEEFEDIADWLIENKWWISNISYSFPDSIVNSGFTENVAFIGNTLRWGNSNDN